MFKNIISFRKKQQDDSHKSDGNEKDSVNKYSEKPAETELVNDVFLNASTILNDPHLSVLVRKIRVTVGVSDKYFDTYYLPVIKNCAVYCQSGSASTDNHHSHSFGLITHLLETTIYSLRSRLQFVYKVTDKEEDIDNYKHIYTYAVFISAMNHDMGKTIGDSRYFIRKNGQEKYTPWNPLSSLPPSEEANIQYKIERKINKSGKVIYKYNTHSIMNTALLSRIVPSIGWDWITSVHPKVETHIYHTVAGDYDNGDVIGKAVKDGDAWSSKLSMQNKVTSIDERGPETTLMTILKKIISSPDQFSLTVNNPSFTTLVKKHGLIYISGSALEAAVRQEAPNHSFSLPSSSNKIEGMIADHYTVKADSGDTMWWLTFTPTGKKPASKKKDIKCFAFAVDLYDPDDMLPEANNIDIHKSMKSMSEEDKVKEAQRIKEELTEEQQTPDVEPPKDSSKKKNKNSNISIGGKANLSPLGNAAIPSVPESTEENYSKNKQTDKKIDHNKKDAITQGNTAETSNKEASNKKFKPSSIKGSDLLGLIEKGTEGVKQEVEESSQPKKAPAKANESSQSKKAPAKANESSQSNKASAKVNESSQSNKASAKANESSQSKKAPAKANESSQSNKASAKVNESSQSNKASAKANESSQSNKTSAKANETNQSTTSKRNSGKKLAPANNVGGTVANLLPSMAALKNVSQEQSELKETFITNDQQENENNYNSDKAINVTETPSIEEKLPDDKEIPTVGIDPNIPDENLPPIEQLQNYDPEEMIPLSYEWENIPETKFDAVIKGNPVTFIDDDSENNIPQTFEDKLSAASNYYSAPSWSLPIKPNIEDEPFIKELFGVLQQAINSGLQFNRLGSQLFIVPYGIFLASPSSFTNSDFPLSTRGDYYKDRIRNSSYLAKSSLDKKKNVTTGRILKVKNAKNGVMKVKTTGALNGFYIITGKSLQLKRNGIPIKPTRYLIFDKYSINGVIKLDNEENVPE